MIEYKLVFNQDLPEHTTVKLLTDPFYDVMVLIGEIKLTQNENGEIDECSLINDFSYLILDKGEPVDELLLGDLTKAVSEILCNLLNTDMVENNEKTAS